MSDVEDAPTAAGAAAINSSAADEAVATIAAVTGADAETAAHLLDAAGGDVDAAVGFFLEGGGGGGGLRGFRGLEGGVGGGATAAAAAAPRDAEDAIVLSDDDGDDGAAAAARGRRRAATTRAAAAPARNADNAVVVDEENDFLDGEGYVDVSDDDEEEEERGGERRQRRPTRAATRAAAGTTAATARPAPLPFDLPDGINAEEARMLEAAMLGIPYEGPMPDFSAEGLAAAAAARDAARVAAEANLSPGAAEARNLRREQDDAYEQSLADDRRKAEQAAARTRRLEEEAAEAAEAEAAAERAIRERAEAADRAAAAAKARLPAEELDDSSPDLVQVAVRCPGGERLSRKFRKSDPVSLLFDFVDSERPSGVVLNPSSTSRSYRLLTSFPRKAIDAEGPGLTFEGAGLCSRAEAVMLELPAAE